MLLKGSCHCGNIRLELDWQAESIEIPARACTCSFCRERGGVWTACHDGMLAVRTRDPDEVSRYAFDTKTAQFHICKRCGAVPVVTSRIDGRVYAVVNVNTFDDVDPSLLRFAPVSFDGEDQANRLTRRAKHWIAHVEFAQPS